MRYLRQFSRQMKIFGCVVMLAAMSRVARPQSPDEGGVSFDGGGHEILESIFVPYVANAPFSMTLAAEWVRPLPNGGTFTVVNSRPIKRDSVGRIYQERWLMAPKGTNIRSRMSWIQISDPVAKTLYQCNAFTKVCDLVTLGDNVSLRFDPTRLKSAALKDGKGKRVHEDLGPTFFAGLPVHEYRDTMTLEPGALGNDMPMTTVRHYRFSAELGFNLMSELEAPQIGRQVFTVTEISTTEPDASWFKPPQGYTVVDRRESGSK
jgi:hypothetical protein